MIIDLITVLLIGLGLYLGYRKGLIKTVFSTLSLIIAIVAALKLSPIVIGLLQKLININPAITFVLGFVLTFLLVMALVRFIGDKLEKLAETASIGGVNKILGAALLGLFYAVLISFGIYFMDRIRLVSDEQKAASFTYPILKPLPQATTEFGNSLKPVFSGFWNKMLETMDAVKEKHDDPGSDTESQPQEKDKSEKSF